MTSEIIISTIISWTVNCESMGDIILYIKHESVQCITLSMAKPIKTSVPIQVIATDGGTPPLTAETTVTVVVLDINDNPPQFSNTSLNLTIPENEPLGSIIGEFVAIDNDQGLAARLEFIVLGEFAER